ncbi:hypothetical protein NGC38_16475 [Kluyvera cryocrescens]|uniref:hypothetical protein n=1 Tax=Kluyvera cryocrescens TaxID=580 RepID=UPI002DBA31D1|nr:hypothetical protein [Kluyvera cryocrescens]MEB7558127.1 hypothetical protein [Kluyvera cryocrescens]
MNEGINGETFPEEGRKISIHSGGSFEGIGCVLANTNLNLLTAVFYWFTLNCDEPKLSPREHIMKLLMYVAPEFADTAYAGSLYTITAPFARAMITMPDSWLYYPNGKEHKYELVQRHFRF